MLAHLSPDTVIHRLTGDSPRELLLAPAWNLDKDAILAAITSAMTERGWRQGCLYQPARSPAPGTESAPACLT